METTEVRKDGNQERNVTNELKSAAQEQLPIEQLMKPLQNERKIRRHRLRPIRPLPSGRLKADKELELLRSYVVQSKSGQAGVRYNEVARLIETHETSVSASKEYWEAIGALSEVSRGIHKPSPEVLSWALKADFAADEANKHLHMLFDSAWFGDTIRQAFAVHKHLKADRLISILAGTAGGEKQETEPRVKALVDILTLTSYLNKSDDGDLVFAGSERDALALSAGGRDAHSQAKQAGEPQVATVAVSRSSQATDFRMPEEALKIEISVAVADWPVADVIRLIKYLRCGTDEES